MEITIEDAKFWKSCIDAVVNLIDEGILEVKPEGVSLKAMDSSQIAMVSFFAPSKAFIDYKVSEPEKLGLNFESFSKFLARAREKEKLKMATAENRLGLDFIGTASRSFKIPLLDLSAGPQKEPKIDFDVTVKVNGGLFKEILGDAKLVSSHLVLDAGSDGFFVEAKGDAGDLREAVAAEIEAKKPARATFPHQFLEEISRACPSDAKITIYLKTNAPIKMEYAIGEASLTYFLAPRIEPA